MKSKIKRHLLAVVGTQSVYEIETPAGLIYNVIEGARVVVHDTKNAALLSVGIQPPKPVVKRAPLPTIAFGKSLIASNGDKKLYVVKDNKGERICYHIVDGNVITPFNGNMAQAYEAIGKTVPVSTVPPKKILPPVSKDKSSGGKKGKAA